MIAFMLNGEYAVINSKRKDFTCFVICNMHWVAQEFDLPDVGKVTEWLLVFTTEEGFYEEDKVYKKSMMVKPRTIALLIERKKN